MAVQGEMMNAYESQKAPYDENAVAPNVLPTANSHMPARSWASPP